MNVERKHVGTQSKNVVDPFVNAIKTNVSIIVGLHFSCGGFRQISIILMRMFSKDLMLYFVNAIRTSE